MVILHRILISSFHIVIIIIHFCSPKCHRINNFSSYNVSYARIFMFSYIILKSKRYLYLDKIFDIGYMAFIGT